MFFLFAFFANYPLHFFSYIFCNNPALDFYLLAVELIPVLRVGPDITKLVQF